jgi:hypothetical protein
MKDARRYRMNAAECTWRANGAGRPIVISHSPSRQEAMDGDGRPNATNDGLIAVEAPGDDG